MRGGQGFAQPQVEGVGDDSYPGVNPPGCLGGREKGRPRTALLLFLRPMKTIVYIDGFNFYYGRLKKTQYK